MTAPSHSAPAPLATGTSTLSEAPDGTALRYTRIGYTFAFIGAFLFSTKAIFIKLAYAQSVDANTLLALRMGFALPIYLAIGWLTVA